MPTNDTKMRAFYARLSPPERARLMARINRTGEYAEMALVRDATPAEFARAYNSRLHILKNLHLPFSGLVEGILHESDSEMAVLLHLNEQLRAKRWQHLVLMGLWRVIRYPLTKREYAQIIDLERSTPETLAAFARFVIDGFDPEETAGFAPALAAWFPTIAEDLPDDQARSAVQTLIQQAIAAGDLPTPTPTTEGPALPWGVLTDWLYQKKPSAYTPHGPDYHIPAVYLLSGLFATWDIRPDKDAAAVVAQREQIIAALKDVAQFPADLLPSPHPAPSSGERKAAITAVEEHWPWAPDPALRERVLRIGQAHGRVRAGAVAMREALAAIQREDFCGEDPLTALEHLMLDQIDERDGDISELWTDIGTMLTGVWTNDTWPALPDPDLEIIAHERDLLLDLLRQ